MSKKIINFYYNQIVFRYCRVVGHLDTGYGDKHIRFCPRCQNWIKYE